MCQQFLDNESNVMDNQRVKNPQTGRARSAFG
jgi:hypothetical protein